jgi:hypothetical protein
VLYWYEAPCPKHMPLLSFTTLSFKTQCHKISNEAFSQPRKGE